MGTHVMLEAAKVHRIKRFIHVSTDEVYGEVVSRVSEEEMVLLRFIHYPHIYSCLPRKKNYSLTAPRIPS